MFPAHVCMPTSVASLCHAVLTLAMQEGQVGLIPKMMSQGAHEKAVVEKVSVLPP